MWAFVFTSTLYFDSFVGFKVYSFSVEQSSQFH